MSIQEANSPASTVGSAADSPPASHPPPTPLSPDSASYMALPTPVDSESNLSPMTNSAPASATAAVPPKRKPSRRANTAERRATHNAVERQRRETLNSRFLDLAALLPNLATVRRPSKSAIVNSSIALVHSNRRQRLIAARELRLLKIEADLLRRELNEWRDRSALPRVDEPARTPEFVALLGPGEGEPGAGGADGAQWWDQEGLGEMGEEERRAYELVLREHEEDGLMEDAEDDYARAMNPAFAKNAHGNVSLQHIMPRGAGLTQQQLQQQHQQQQHQQQQQQQQQQQHQQQLGFARMPALGLDGGMVSHPALHSGVHTMYEPSGHPHGHSHALPVHPAFGALDAAAQHQAQAQQQQQQSAVHLVSAAEKLAWAANAPTALYAQGVAPAQWAHQLAGGAAQQPPQQALFTPPASAHGGSAPSSGGNPPSPLPLGNPFNAQAFLNLQQHQAHQQQQMAIGALGHGHVYASPELDDASSVGSGGDGGARGSSAGGSPGPQVESFEIPVGGGGGGGGVYGRKPSLSLNMPSGQWSAPPAQPQPLATGGGGGRHLNAMMSMMM